MRCKRPSPTMQCYVQVPRSGEYWEQSQPAYSTTDRMRMMKMASGCETGSSRPGSRMAALTQKMTCGPAGVDSGGWLHITTGRSTRGIVYLISQYWIATLIAISACTMFTPIMNRGARRTTIPITNSSGTKAIARQKM